MKLSNFNVSACAHAKIVLHACKFPFGSVNGVLLGRAAGDDVEIVDAVPFFHSHVSLPLRLELALAQSDEYARDCGLSLVGYYTAGESVTAHTSDAAAKAVTEKINQKFPHACLLLVSNEDFRAPFNGCLQLLVVQQDQLRPAKPEQLVLARNDVSDLVRDKTFRALADFEDHLRDTTHDWRNKQLVA